MKFIETIEEWTFVKYEFSSPVEIVLIDIKDLIKKSFEMSLQECTRLSA